MKAKTVQFKSIDDYIATFPKNVQPVLKEMRKTIRVAAPEAAEKISYHMPTFWLNGNLVHFAAWKHHIGFYPAFHGTGKFAKELAPYTEKGSTPKFPIDEPLPVKLISRVVRFGVEMNLKKEKAKPRAKKVKTIKTTKKI